jgi:hypothetical protein
MHCAGQMIVMLTAVFMRVVVAIVMVMPMFMRVMMGVLV